MGISRKAAAATVAVGITVALGQGGVPSAVVANPDVNHFTIVDSSTDSDFCGTGQAVEISVSLRGTEFLAPNQPVDYRNVTEGNIVYTNPQNGATVTRHVAGPFSDMIISGDPEGVSTHEFTLIGLSTLLRTPDGGVLVRNAGYLVLHQVIDAEGNVLSSEIVVDKGPPHRRERLHPDLRRHHECAGADLAADPESDGAAAGLTTTSDPTKAAVRLPHGGQTVAVESTTPASKSWTSTGRCSPSSPTKNREVARYKDYGHTGRRS